MDHPPTKPHGPGLRLPSPCARTSSGPSGCAAFTEAPLCPASVFASRRSLLTGRAGDAFRSVLVTARWPRQPSRTHWVLVMVRRAAGRIGEWTGLDPSACFGSFFVPTRGRWLYRPRSREGKSFTSLIMNHNAGSGLVPPVSDMSHYGSSGAALTLACQ